MKKDVSDAIMPIVIDYTTAQAFESSRRILNGEDPVTVFAEADAAFNKRYYAAIEEVESRPWWRRLRNLLP